MLLLFMVLVVPMCTIARAPKLIFFLPTSGVLSPVTIAVGLMCAEIPFLVGKALSHLVIDSTREVVINFVYRR